MPAVLDDLPGTLNITLPTNAIAIVLPLPSPPSRYPIEVGLHAVSSAAGAAWDGTENAAIAHDFPIKADSDLVLEVERWPTAARRRHVFGIIFGAVPADEETVTVSDGVGGEVEFEADVAADGAAGGGTAVTGGSSLANWVAALAAAISASALAIEASVNPRNTARLDLIGTSSLVTITIDDGTGGDIVATRDLGTARPILYVDGTGSASVRVVVQRAA